MIWSVLILSSSRRERSKLIESANVSEKGKKVGEKSGNCWLRKLSQIWIWISKRFHQSTENRMNSNFDTCTWNGRKIGKFNISQLRSFYANEMNERERSDVMKFHNSRVSRRWRVLNSAGNPLDPWMISLIVISNTKPTTLSDFRDFCIDVKFEKSHNFLIFVLHFTLMQQPT